MGPPATSITATSHQTPNDLLWHVIPRILYGCPEFVCSISCHIHLVNSCTNVASHVFDDVQVRAAAGARHNVNRFSTEKIPTDPCGVNRGIVLLEYRAASRPPQRVGVQMGTLHTQQRGLAVIWDTYPDLNGVTRPDRRVGRMWSALWALFRRLHTSPAINLPQIKWWLLRKVAAVAIPQVVPHHNPGLLDTLNRKRHDCNNNAKIWSGIAIKRLVPMAIIWVYLSNTPDDAVYSALAFVLGDRSVGTPPQSAPRRGWADGVRNSRIQRLLRRPEESILSRLSVQKSDLFCLWDDFRGRPDLGRSFTEPSSRYRRQTSFTVEMGIPSCAYIAALLMRPLSFKPMIWYRSTVQRLSISVYIESRTFYVIHCLSLNSS